MNEFFKNYGVVRSVIFLLTLSVVLGLGGCAQATLGKIGGELDGLASSLKTGETKKEADARRKRALVKQQQAKRQAQSRKNMQVRSKPIGKSSLHQQQLRQQRKAEWEAAQQLRQKRKAEWEAAQQLRQQRKVEWEAAQRRRPTTTSKKSAKPARKSYPVKKKILLKKNEMMEVENNMDALNDI